jgi:hypothetical protein
VDHVKVVGGEPLLHPDLAGLLKAIRGSGIGGRVRVATNGTVFARAGWDWLQHADDIHVSRYPGTQVREAEMAELVDRCRATDTELVVKTYERFRLVLPESPLKPDEAKEVFSTCQLAHGWSCHTVEDGYFYLCPPGAQLAHGGAEDDRCPISPAKGLEVRMRALLDRVAPLAACTNCLGSAGTLVPHQQTTRRQWVALSLGRLDKSQLRRLKEDFGSHNGCYQDNAIVPGVRDSVPPAS